MEVRWFLEVRGFLLQFTGESEASTVEIVSTNLFR